MMRATTAPAGPRPLRSNRATDGRRAAEKARLRIAADIGVAAPAGSVDDGAEILDSRVALPLHPPDLPRVGVAEHAPGGPDRLHRAGGAVMGCGDPAGLAGGVGPDLLGRQEAGSHHRRLDPHVEHPGQLNAVSRTSADRHRDAQSGGRDGPDARARDAGSGRDGRPPPSPRCRPRRPRHARPRPRDGTGSPCASPARLRHGWPRSTRPDASRRFRLVGRPRLNQSACSSRTEGATPVACADGRLIAVLRITPDASSFAHGGDWRRGSKRACSSGVTEGEAKARAPLTCGKSGKSRRQERSKVHRSAV